ncbi:MAG TPA: carbohydrate kinase [Firmicutes bacterium]|nr:carbohydrate kinase [Bacillota bacterium]
MTKVISIGEALIDFMPTGETGYELSPGGAPANVAACVSILGGESQIITKLGNDFFGDYLLGIMKSKNINCSSVLRTNEANTGLAFVSHTHGGERSFLFYRNPSSDMLLDESEIKEEWFEKGDVLHFCSVDLVDAPVRKAHDKAIEIAWKKRCFICFDPNIRLSLWDDHEEYKNIVNKYIDYADIIKVSDEELFFITGITNEEEAIKTLLNRVQMVVYTKGRKGAEVFTKVYHVSHLGHEAEPIDTTGAGDSFIGAFLYQLIKKQVDGEFAVDKIKMEEILDFANKVASMVVEQKGTIDIMPTLEQVNQRV